MNRTGHAKVYRIHGREEEGWENSIFYKTVTGGIYAENAEIGFFKHPTIKSEKALADHLTNMVNQGFTVDTYEI